MMKNILSVGLLVLFFVLASFSVFGLDFWIFGDNVKYAINPSTGMNDLIHTSNYSGQNISADYFIGDGGFLTNVSGSDTNESVRVKGLETSNTSTNIRIDLINASRIVDNTSVNERIDTVNNSKLNHTGNQTFNGALEVSGFFNVSYSESVFKNVTVSDKLFFGTGQNNFIKKNSGNVFNDISIDAFWFHHLEMHSAGFIAYLLTYENRTLAWNQVGRNNSYSGSGNSFGVIPNNWGVNNFSNVDGTVNMTKLSDYTVVCDTFGTDCLYNADTSGEGPLLWTAGPLEVWKSARLHEGLISSGTASFGMQGNKFSVFNGSILNQVPVTREIGVNSGDNVSVVSEDFSGNTLGKFSLISCDAITTCWDTVIAVQCHSAICANAGSNVVTVMELNTSSSNIGSINLSFWATEQNIDLSDTWDVQVNNYTGSGWVDVFVIADLRGASDSFFTKTLNANMNNASILGLRITANLDHPINEFVWMDDFSMLGTFLASTLTNVTCNDASFLTGSGDGTEGLFYNCATMNWTITPGGLTATITGDVVTTSINLSTQVISSWSQINQYLTPFFVNSSDWTTNNDYPAACTGTQFVKAIGDTNTCATPNAGIESFIVNADGTGGSQTMFDGDTLGFGNSDYLTATRVSTKITYTLDEDLMNQTIGTIVNDTITNGNLNATFFKTTSTVFIINLTANMCIVQNGTDLLISNNLSSINC